MNKKVLLVGGAGFIGSRFCQLTKNKITVIDKTNGYDISKTVLLQGEFDTVIFLAAEPNLKAVKENPLQAYATMTKGLHKCVDYYKNSHFVYVSSSMVYGNWIKDSMSENESCIPQNIYGQLKLLGEGIVKQFHSNWTIVRPSAVYGANDNPNRVVNLFINKIQDNEQITLQGADNLFDFTHVDDVVQGLELIVDQTPSHETFNITNGQAHSLQTMTEMLYDKLGKPYNFISEPLPADYPLRGSLDISKAISKLQYKPNYNLSRGLDDTINKS